MSKITVLAKDVATADELKQHRALTRRVRAWAVVEVVLVVLAALPYMAANAVVQGTDAASRWWGGPRNRAERERGRLSWEWHKRACRIREQARDGE